MINHTRRNTLKTIAAATAVAIAPAVASAAASQPYNKPASTAHTTGLQLEFGNGLSGQLVTISNNSDKAITLKHVYPGIVHANGKTYDINSVLQKKAMTLAAGSSLNVPLNAIAQTTTEQPLPKGLRFSKPLKVSTRVRNMSGETPVTTLRSYMA